MGAKDIKTKEYIADNSRFADLFNYKCYGGKQIIQPEDLEERDSAEILNLLGTDRKEIQVQKLRDVLKHTVIRSTPEAYYVLLGVENQTDIHYAMPVRAMLYDALNYAKQIRETTKLHKDQKDKMIQAEFLSGFKKTDCLIPIISITLYWGADEWNGPTHLREMLGEMDEELMQFIPDYHINLVAPNLIQDFEKFRTELGQTLEFIKYSKDKENLKVLLSNLKNKKLTNETVSAINMFTGANIKLDEKGEVTDVCLAIEEIKKEYAAEQIAKEVPKEVAKAVSKELAKEIIRSVDGIVEDLNVSLEKACKSIRHTVEDYEKAKQLLEKM